MERKYLAIDLKSFYASVECVERGLDPLSTNLVVADASRTEKTICLAVSPSLKAYGIPGRPRLFEVVQRLRTVNAMRRQSIPYGRFSGTSSSDLELRNHPDWEVGYIAAPPRMSLYMAYSKRIYQIYLKYVAPEDVHVYSVDEVFIDVTDYLGTYKMTAHELAMAMIRDVLAQTGITATAGIGTNMYLCKIAMDIVAKHMPADKDGVRIAELDEMSYRRQLWSHQPLTDFWRVGRGTAQRLEKYGIKTMGQLARMSVQNEEALYKLFGVNAELLIDHAWGWEPCTMPYVKAYRPESNSLSSGQVLREPYDAKKAKVVIKEMTDSLALDLVSKGLVADQMVLDIGYDTSSVDGYVGEVVSDRYGRPVPKPSHGSSKLGRHTSSSRLMTEAVMRVFDEVVGKGLLIRRMNVTANNVIREGMAEKPVHAVQLELFSDVDAIERNELREEESLGRERSLQKSLLEIKRKYGKNSILRGLDFEDGATAIERNGQIGGHKA